MNWTKLTIYTSHEGIDAVSGILLNAGVTGCSIEDSQDFEEFIKTETPRWDFIDEKLDYLRNCETSLTAYLPSNEQGEHQIQSILEGLNLLKEMDSDQFGRLETQISTVREEDWADNWKQYFKPTPVGNRLLIKPAWETVPEYSTDRMVLEIDPSACFGTGTHATTRLCLDLLENTVRGGEAVLDMGCGSGILGIACALLGAGSITAVDVDENAVRIAGENFNKNHIRSEKVKLLCGDVLQDASLKNQLGRNAYNIVIANIVADVIISMLEILTQCVAQNGLLLLSGIIDNREADILQTIQMAGKFDVIKRREMDSWIALLIKPSLSTD